MTDRFELTVNVQVFDVPMHAPLHGAPGSGVAVSVTTLPAAYDAADGSTVTVPLPVLLMLILYVAPDVEPPPPPPVAPPPPPLTDPPPPAPDVLTVTASVAEPPFEFHTVQGPEPAWSKSVKKAMGRPGEYLGADRTLEIGAISADFKPGPDDYWFEHVMYFQEAPGSRVAAAGDLMVTAHELNPVLSALTDHHFKIEGVHNHMTEEQPGVFFVHFWRVGSPEELAAGLNAALALVNTRK